MNTSPQHFLSNRRSYFVYLIVLAFLLCPAAVLCQEKTGKLVITFTNIRSSKGQLCLAIYNDPSQWTKKPYKAVLIKKEDMQNGTISVEVPGLLRGKSYACCILDDENRSFDMEYFAGIPKEGWGMSTNPSFVKLKAPVYEDVSFILDGPAVHFDMKLNYVQKNKKIK